MPPGKYRDARDIHAFTQTTQAFQVRSLPGPRLSYLDLVDGTFMPPKSPYTLNDSRPIFLSSQFSRCSQ